MQPPRLPRCLVGRTTKLGVNECWVALFLENEKRYRNGGKPRPRTDRELSEFIRREFSDPYDRDSKVWEKVAATRYRYNRGRLYKGQTVPKIKSYRYNVKGDRVPARYFDPFEPRKGELTTL